MSFEKLLKRPEITMSKLSLFGYERQDLDVETEVETFIKYDGYIQKSLREAQKMSRLEHKKIPELIAYDKISNMSLEAREKLSKKYGNILSGTITLKDHKQKDGNIWTYVRLLSKPEDV